MKRILVAIVILISIGVVLANAQENSGTTFSEANTLYEKGDYVGAITKYEDILVSGRMSGALYYNLGNSYFKEGKLGLAVLNYLRARLLMPRDADLNANLRFAGSMVKRKMIAKDGIWGWKPLRMVLENFTINELTYIASGMFILALAGILIASYGPFGRRYFIMGVMILFALVIASAVIISHKARVNSRAAVVLLPEVEAKFGPFESGGKFFEIKEGMVVEVLHRREGWAKIRRADGKIGWVKDGVIEKVMGTEG